MARYDDMSDQDKDSEFDSEDENVEFQLYQQLYFEPNPDITKVDTKSKPLTQGQHEDNIVPETCDKQFAHTDGCHLKQAHTPKHMLGMKSLPSPHTVSTTGSKIHENRNPQIENCIYLDTAEGEELTLTDFTVQLNKKDTQNHPQQTELHGNTGHEASVSNVPLVKSNVVPLQSIRERLSSTCSDGSIPGRVPLDGLYCNLVTSDEEDDITIKDRLVMKGLPTNNQESNKEKAKAKSNKRKRRKTASDDEVEDSRCNSLISATSKTAVSKDDIGQLGYDSNPDEDIYILPPPKPRNPDILTIESSSDNEVEARKGDATCIRTKSNKYRKIEQPTSSVLTKKKEGKSKGMNQISGSGEKQGKEGDNVVTVVDESESDTNDVDMPEATKGTDLTLNIDKSLSGWVKTITKDLDTTKKKKKPAKKSYNKNNRPTVDFTKGRPNTTTVPSCEKWTQSMANFYDSDVSDDFDVSEIHLQQSDSPADWHLVADDYQISQRRRYYNAPERCKLCKQEGHTVNKCPRVPTCHLCSENDHAHRSDCPQNCCFKCGAEPHFFCPATDRGRVCNLCGFPGHLKDFCPDLWRRFHMTTNGLIAQTPSEHSGCSTRLLRKRYCYSCGKRGHYGHECPIRFQNRYYSQVPQSVVSYCRPVNLVDGRFVVNIDGTQSAQPETSMTTMPIRQEDVGRIIGKKGTVVKTIIKDSGAHVRVIQEGQPQVLLFGPSEARLQAQEIIEALLRNRDDGHVGFVDHMNNDNWTSGISESTSWTESDSWIEHFLAYLDRRKSYVLKEMKKILETLHQSRKVANLSTSVKKLKAFIRTRESEPSKEPSQSVIGHLSKIVMRIVGSRRHGNGLAMHQKITYLQKQVQTCRSSIVPENICIEIAKTLRQLHEPSVEKLDELLLYAEQCTNIYLKRRANYKRNLNKNIESNENKDVVKPNEKPKKKKKINIAKKNKAMKKKRMEKSKIKQNQDANVGKKTAKKVKEKTKTAKKVKEKTKTVKKVKKLKTVKKVKEKVKIVKKVKKLKTVKKKKIQS